MNLLILHRKNDFLTKQKTVSGHLSAAQHIPIYIAFAFYNQGPDCRFCLLDSALKENMQELMVINNSNIG